MGGADKGARVTIWNSVPALMEMVVEYRRGEERGGGERRREAEAGDVERGLDRGEIAGEDKAGV